MDGVLQNDAVQDGFQVPPPHHLHVGIDWCFTFDQKACAGSRHSLKKMKISMKTAKRQLHHPEN